MYTATYSPEDNKLRLTVNSRLPQDLYEKIRKAGFRWAPKQEIFVAPAWTPGREDILLELVDEIEDEDYSREERAADRAERFSGYRDRRAAEAGAAADAFDSGPAVHGYASESRALRAACRHDRLRTGAVSCWEKAEYWQERTRAVISHHLYKSLPAVRRSRIKRLETEQRRHLKTIEDAKKVYRAWQEVRNEPDDKKATAMAYRLANYHKAGGCDFKHPRTGEETSIYNMLVKETDPITGHEAAVLVLASYPYGEPCQAGSYSDRWSKHFELRLAYERQMLEAEGGAASESEMQPGGWIGSHQILKVHKSPATGRVVSVSIKGEWGFTDVAGQKVYTDHADRNGLANMNIERLPADVYRAPTAEDLETFAETMKAITAKNQRRAAAQPKLINPTPADAERLQAMFNQRQPAEPPTQVRVLTQAEYTRVSGGRYSHYETVAISERGKVFRNRISGTTVETPVFKVRMGPSGSDRYNAPRAVIVLSDKPQKPIPWDLMEEIERSHMTADEIAERRDLLRGALRQQWFHDIKDEERKIFDDAMYRDLVWVQSDSQFGLTEAGHKILKEADEAAEVSR